MEFLQGLQDRASTPLLVEPGPDKEQLQAMFRAALRAPDHARLRPWRFLTIAGEARHALGEVFIKAALANQPDLSEDAVKRFKNLPMRAPVLVALICKISAHPKVPEIEQQLSVAAAAQNILNAAHAMGIGAMWRTGAINYHPATAKGLGLKPDEQLLGFIYLGTPGGSKKKRDSLEVKDFVQEWQGVRNSNR